MSLKVAVVGGGSTYTPELVEGLLRQTDRLPVDELVLFDLDADRLDVVGGLAQRMADQAGWPGRLERTTSRPSALDGADYVLVQVRVGGQGARLRDETLPPRLGTLGQETTGAGGFAKALRTVPVVLDIAEEAARRAAAGSWLINFTNPVGIVTQALLDEGHRAVGLCNVAITIQRRLAASLGVPPDRVQLEHVGLNHLSWVTAVYVDGIDRLPELLETAIDQLVDEARVPARLLRALRVLPSSYLRYYYCSDEVLAEQVQGARSRAATVMGIESELLELYRDPTLVAKPALLAKRGGAFYSEAATRLMASLHTGTGDVQVVDTYNRGAIRDLPADAVVEVPARIDPDGPQPLPLPALAPELLALVQHIKGYERLAIDAAESGDRVIALRALMAHPLIGRYELASRLLDAQLEVDRDHLPRFFRSG